MATAKLSVKEAAAEIGTDPRTLRKFIRSNSCDFDPVGQGNRYEFTKGEVGKLKKQFLAWSGGATKTEAPTSKKKGKKTPPIEEVDEDIMDDVEEIDLDELDDPDIEDLEEAEEDGDFTAEEEDEPDLDDDGEVVDLSDLDD